MPPPEWIIPVATFLLGGAISLATWIFQRELRRSDNRDGEAKDARHKLQEKIDEARHKLQEEVDMVERESLKRDDQLQREMASFRQEAFANFVQQPALTRLEEKIDKLMEYMMTKGSNGSNQ